MTKINKKTIRASFIDYSNKGHYFITIKTFKNQHFFGKIKDGKMHLNLAARIIEKAIHKTVSEIPELKCQHYIIMPDHVHFIFELSENMEIQIKSSSKIPSPKGVQICIQRFKSMSTNIYIKHVKEGTLPAFQHKIWHPNYYERLIRTESELKNVINYIKHNPGK